MKGTNILGDKEERVPIIKTDFFRHSHSGHS